MPPLPLASTEPDRPSLAAAAGKKWIFGYGSLVHIESLAGFLARHRRTLGAHRRAELVGFARTWSVAMDNSKTLPRYKYYLDPTTGARPEVFVAFANIERHHEQRVSGILFETDAAMLELLDARERNYRRADVSAHVSIAVEGTVWSYIGSAQANARYHHALRNDALVIDKAYVQGIESAFARARLPYAAALPPNVPLVELTRVDT